MRVAKFVFFVGMVGGSLPASASTLEITTLFQEANQIISNSTCNGFDVSTTVGTKTCINDDNSNGNYDYDATAIARTTNESIGVKATVSVTNPLSASASSFSRGISVSHNFYDVLDFGSQLTGKFILPVDIAGTFNTPRPPSGGTGEGGSSTASINIDVSTWRLAGATQRVPEGSNVLYSAVSSDTTGAAGPIFSSTGSLGVTPVVFDIMNGKVNLYVGMSATAGCANGRFVSCTATVDFLNSARFLGASVLDGNGNEVNNFSITSASGFDYVTGADPHNSTPPVPLPAGVWLMLTAVGAFATQKRLKRRAA